MEFLSSHSPSAAQKLAVLLDEQLESSESSESQDDNNADKSPPRQSPLPRRKARKQKKVPLSPMDGQLLQTALHYSRQAVTGGIATVSHTAPLLLHKYEFPKQKLTAKRKLTPAIANLGALTFLNGRTVTQESQRGSSGGNEPPLEPRLVEPMLVSLGSTHLQIGPHHFPDTKFYRFIIVAAAEENEVAPSLTTVNTAAPSAIPSLITEIPLPPHLSVFLPPSLINSTIPPPQQPPPQQPPPQQPASPPPPSICHGLLVKFRENHRDVFYIPPMQNLVVQSDIHRKYPPHHAINANATMRIEFQAVANEGAKLTFCLHGPYKQHIFHVMEAIQEQVVNPAASSPSESALPSVPQQLSFPQLADAMRQEEDAGSENPNPTAAFRQQLEADKKAEKRRRDQWERAQARQIRSKTTEEDAELLFVAEEKEDEDGNNHGTQDEKDRAGSGKSGSPTLQLPPQIPYPRKPCAYCNLTVSGIWYQGPSPNHPLCLGCGRAWAKHQILVNGQVFVPPPPPQPPQPVVRRVGRPSLAESRNATRSPVLLASSPKPVNPAGTVSPPSTSSAAAAVKPTSSSVASSSTTKTAKPAKPAKPTKPPKPPKKTPLPKPAKTEPKKKQPKTMS